MLAFNIRLTQMSARMLQKDESIHNRTVDFNTIFQ